MGARRPSLTSTLLTLRLVKLARELELRLERLVEGLSATLFRGRLHPVDLANRLVRFVDLSVTDGDTGPEIGNRYVVRVHPSDLDSSIDLKALNSELAAAVREIAAQHGWRIGGPIAVSVAPDLGIGSGGVTCTATADPGPIHPWSQLIEPSGAAVHDIGDNRVRVGRASDADVRIAHSRVSRHHALIYREGQVVTIVDLDSANGTSVNGNSLPAGGAEIGPGDLIAVGPATFSFRLLM
jgi:hypothetical protein